MYVIASVYMLEDQYNERFIRSNEVVLHPARGR